MKNIFSVFFATILLLSFLSCGKKGEILPPLVRFPQTAEDVRAAQRSDQIILTWQNPISYDDGSPLSAIEEIEVWVLEVPTDKEAGTSEVGIEEFKLRAELFATITKDQISDKAVPKGSSKGQMSYSYMLAGKDFLSKKYTFGLRIKEKKRYSPFSVLVSLRPAVLPLPPTDLAAVVFPDRIEIKWHPPAEQQDSASPANITGYNIYRSEEGGEPQRLNAVLIEGEEYNDKNFIFGQTYRYFVRSSAAEVSPYLESEDSRMVEISARDTFAPEPPKGLISVAGQNVLSISWDVNTEEDLDGYRVWRREEEAEEFRLLTRDLIKENSFNDGTVEKGKIYVYAVTALDKNGNESQKSKNISDMIRERLR